MALSILQKNRRSWFSYIHQAHPNCINCGRCYTESVLDVRIHCIVGCIVCGICEKNCPSRAIQLVNSLPVIDYSKCTTCDVCVQKCPSKSILHITT